MRPALLILAFAFSQFTMVFAQQPVQESSVCAGAWYLIQVEFNNEGKAWLRKEIGTENGIFSQARYDENWRSIQRNIENRVYRLGIWPDPQGCEYESQDSIQRGTDGISFRTAANTCSGCGVIKNGVFKMESPLCTSRGCDIEGAIFNDLSRPLPIRIWGELLVIGSEETRCVYYLMRDQKK
jgi:hypothetical protein